MARESWLKRNWFWIGPLVGIVAGAVGTVFLAVMRIDNALNGQVPDIKKALDELGSRIEKSASQQRADLQAHAADERQLRERMGTYIKALQSHVIALKTRVEGSVKPDDIKDLVQRVQDVSVAEAKSLSGLTEVSGTPQTYTAIRSAVMDGAVPEWGGTTYAQLHDFKAKVPIEKSLTLLLFAKNAHWKAVGNSLDVSYDGGKARFVAKPNAKFEDLVRQAEVFNSVSDAVKAMGEYSPSTIKKPIKPSGVSQQRAPELPGITGGRDSSPIIPGSPPELQLK